MKEYNNWHPNFPVNLANCKDEPIHIPGAVQEFGLFIAFDEVSREIVAISENAKKHFPELETFQEKPVSFDSIISIKEFSDLPRDLKRQRERRLVEVTFNSESTLKKYFGVRYWTPEAEVLEVELTSANVVAPSTSDYLANMPLMMREVQSHENVVELSSFVAQKIKELTGFDRVMVYKYDTKWNGQVIAEAKEDHLESFFGLHYPASDIPPQARALYEKNWTRIIPTVHYRPSLIVPASFQGIDLSNSILRSVSPIHIKYLKNMGVAASMSISLIMDGKLWGLIACHHYSEHLVPLNIRMGCEAYGQLVSWHIKTLESAEALKSQVEGENALQEVLQIFSREDNFKVAAQEASADLLKLFKCSGIVIRLGDERVCLGENPGEIFCAAVSKSLLNRSVLEPVVSEEIRALPSLQHAVSQIPNEDVSGLLALALSPEHNYYIICVRQEIKKTVSWAGNPQKKQKVDFDNPAERLVPRGSFALWEEMHEGQSEPWSSQTIELLKKFGLLFFKIVIERKELVEKSNSELKALNQAKDEFVATVSHELRTPLNAIIGWTDLALSGELDKDRVPEALKIIQRNARSQNQLVADLLDVSRIISGKMKLSVRNMRVTEVVETVVLSFTPAADTKNIKIISHLDDTADSIIGDPNRIQQVIWNLLSNAVKFSSKGSKIWIKVHRINSQIELLVKDEGMGIEAEDYEKIFGRFQQVDSSTARRAGGLGLGLAISKHIVELHGGRIQVYSEGLGKGTAFQVFFPIAPVLPKERNDELPIDDFFENTNHIDDDKKVLKGEVILIVEDEPDASRFLKLLIDAHGAKTYTAFNGREALEILEKHKSEIGIVLSDVGMPEMDGYTLVKTIRSSPDPKIRSICAIALTAFGRPQDRINALRAGFESYIAKPVMQDELIAVLESVCKSKKR